MRFNIIGKGGFGREVAGILCDKYGIDYYDGDDRIKFFEDGKFSAVQEILFDDPYGIAYIGVGSPQLKKKFVEQLEITNIKTPILFARTALERDYNKSNEIGHGSIFCDGVIITTNVKIGKFVTLNLNVTVGHDSEIGDFTTINPGSNISGNVRIGKGCEIGTNVSIIPGVVLPDNGIIGAGSVVTKTPDLEVIWQSHKDSGKLNQLDESFFDGKIYNYVMVGNPARVLKINGVRV